MALLISITGFITFSVLLKRYKNFSETEPSEEADFENRQVLQYSDIPRLIFKKFYWYAFPLYIVLLFAAALQEFIS